jgi:hypothetical protein
MIINNSNEKYNSTLITCKENSSFKVQNRNVGGEIKKGVSFSISSLDAVPLKEGSDEALIDVKLNSLKKIANSQGVFNAGVQADMTTLTYLVKDILKQQFFEMGGRNISDYFPINHDAQFRYKAKSLQKVQTFFGKRDRNDGVARMSGKVANQKANVGSNFEVIEFDNYQFLNSIQYDNNEINMGMVDLIPYDVVKDRVEMTKTNWDLQYRDNIFGGNSTLGINGFVNHSQIDEDASTISKSPVDMTGAEIQQLCINLMNIRTQMKSVGLNSLPDTLLTPETIKNGLAAKTLTGGDFTGLGENRVQFIERTTGFKIDTIPFFEKDVGLNQGLNNENKFKYMLYSKNPEILEAKIPLDFTMQGFFTGDGFHFVSYGMAQFTELIVRRKAGIKMFSHS